MLRFPRITLKMLAAGLLFLPAAPTHAQFQVTIQGMTVTDGGAGDTDNKPNAIGFGNWPPSNPPVNPPIVISMGGATLNVSGHAIQEFNNGRISEVRFDYLNIVNCVPVPGQAGQCSGPAVTSSITVQSGIFAVGGPPFFGRVHLSGKYTNAVRGRNLQNAQISLTGSVLMPAAVDIGTITVPASGQDAPSKNGGKPQKFGPGTNLPTKDVAVKLGVGVSQLTQTVNFTLGDGDQIVTVGSMFSAGYTADTIFTVNSAADLPDGLPGQGVCDIADTTTHPPTHICTLRAALTESNFINPPATSAVQFNIPGTGAPRITVNNNPSGNEGNMNATNVIIDGTTQPGGLVELDGSQASLISAGDTIVGLNLDGENSTVLGMVINGFLSHAIQLRPTSGPIGNNVIEENLIGTDTTGLIAIPNGGDGVHIGSMPNNSVRDNIIANNTGQGVSVGGSDATGNRIHANAITSNGGLGIALTGGGNNLQPAPNLSSATEDGSNLTIGGTLHSAPNLAFNLDVFVNSQCDPSGSGEGETHLGSTIATTDTNGDATFTATLPADPSEGLVATATATDSLGNTSQFSACATILPGAPPNQPPVANAGPNQTVTAGILVTLDGTASFDPDNGPSPLTFLWTQTSGPTVVLTGPTTATPTFTPTQTGTYVFTLVVNDGLANSPSANVTITVATPSLSVQVISSGFLFSRVTRTFNGTVTVTNTTGSSIPGPLQVAFADLPATVTLANATGVVDGVPFITLPGPLAPGQSASFTVQFSNPSNVNIHYSPIVN